MTPLPAWSTDRYRYTYSNAFAQHSVIWRMLDSLTVTADVDALMQALIGSVGLGCSQSTITSLDKAEIGSNIFNPVDDSTLIGDNFGSTTANGYTNSISVNFVGRCTDGHRTRVGLFGWRGDVSEWRLTAAEDTGVATMVAALNSVGNKLIGIGGLHPTWKAYADINGNDHWVRKAR